MGHKRGKRSWLGRWRSKSKEDATANDPKDSAAETPLCQNDSLISGTNQSAIGESQSKPEVIEDLWNAAYESLTEDEKTRLDSIPRQLLEASHDDHHAGKPIVSKVLENVINTVETQYKVRKMKNDTSKIRKAAKNILDTAYSMQSFIGSIAAADPTGHAATAWAVVSLGIKLTQNDSALQGALFDTSEFLTRALGRYTLAQDILQKSEKKNHSVIKKSLVELYAEVLRYALEMDRVRNLRVLGRIWAAVSVSDITGQAISSLQQKIKDQEEGLKTVVVFTHQIQSQNLGEKILARIEQNTILLEEMSQHNQFSNLQDRFVSKAEYGTREDLHEGVCLEGTRKDLLQDILDWVDDRNGEIFFWLNGMAGTGKSTISRTLAQHFQSRGILGASFFFKRGEQDCNSTQKFMPTIAHQLMRFLPILKREILEVCKDDNVSLFDSSLKNQFEELLLNPLQQIQFPEGHGSTIVIIIDAADECVDENSNGMREVVDLLSRLPDANAFKWRFFITGRPDPAVREIFASLNRTQHQYREVRLQDVESAKDDISIFIRASLYQIREKKIQDHRIREESMDPETWPEESIIEKIIDKANPLFIVASTICRFIGAPKFFAVERTKTILQSPRSDDKLLGTYRTVLYQFVSDTALEDRENILQDFQDIVGSIILLYDPLPIAALADLLSVSENRVRLRLDDLHSVFVVPDGQDLPVRMLHLSFRDVLLDQNSSDIADFRVDKTGRNHILSMQCIELMSNGLRHNILGLENDGVLRSEIDATKLNLEPHLKYACRYWLQHLQDGTSSFDHGRVYGFLSKHFLQWLEVIGALGLISEALRNLMRLERTLSGTSSNKLGLFLNDAVRFVRRAGETISIAPLQVYSSALIFSPANSIIRQKFNSQIPKCFIALPRVTDEWNALLQNSESFPYYIDDLVFLPDGSLLASTCYENMTMIWNFDEIGDQKAKIQPSPSRPVSTSVISPDGNLVACVFQNGVIQIWRLDSPDLVKFLPATDNPQDHDGYGHPDMYPDDWTIRRTSFSFNSQILATATKRKVQLWDVSGNDVHSLHSFCEEKVVESIGFLNGDRHFYYSTHAQVKVYRVEDHGVPWSDPIRVIPFEQSSSPGLVAHSRDSQRLAVSVKSSFREYTIQVHDSDISTTELGIPIKTVMAHSGNSEQDLKAINLSPNGRWLLCTFGSILRLWDLDGQVPELAQWSRNGRSAWVFYACAFSRDGRLACATENGVQLWEIDKLVSDDAWKAVSPSPIIDGIEISPDGQRLALSSLPEEVQIWDTGVESLNIIHTLSVKDRYERVGSCLCFSRDGQVLAFSPMKDESIALWDLKQNVVIRRLGANAYDHYIYRVMSFSSDYQVLLSAGSLVDGGQLVEAWDLSKKTCDPYKYFGCSVHVPEDLCRPLAIALSLQNLYLVASYQSGEDSFLIVWDFDTCEILRKVFVPGPVMILRFSEEGSYIITERGVFPLTGLELDHEASMDGHRQYSSRLAVRDDWIVTGSQRRIWLPSEERGVWTSHGEALYIGTNSGRLQKYVVRDDRVEEVS